MLIFAVFSYVFLPWSYMWLIMGGGVSRSVGAFFGILSLHSIFLLYTKQKKIFIISSGIFSSLTILSHLGVSAFVFISALIFILFLGKNRTSIIYSLYVGILVLVLTSPWWFTIITRHGIEPILSALNSGYGDYRKNAIINLIFFRFTGEISLTILGVLCMYGVFISVFDRQYILPVWLLAIFIAIPRASPEYATIPAALLISKGIYQIAIPIFKKKSKLVNNNKAPSIFLDSVLIFYILFLLLLSAIFNVYGPCKELSIDDRDAMAWVDANTNIESEFVVINVSSKSWADDSISEWFPILAQRKVLNLVQGSEWLGSGQFHKKWRLNKELIKCVDQESTCIKNILDSYKIQNIYIFISRNDEPIEKNLSLAIPVVENSMHKNKIFKLIFQNNKVSIFKNQRLS